MVSSSLAYALGAPETANRHLAIRMTKNDSKDIIHFLFNGKTVYEWHSQHEYWSSMLEKLRTLEKEGPALRYGEHLYTEGIPEDDPVCGSETWTKEHYDTRIAWYGQSFLERYIKDGIFDLKRASSDRNKAEKELATVGDTLPKAYRAYRQQSAAGKETILHAQNISTLFLEGELYLFVTPSMFQTMKLEDKEDFTFYLAERNPFIDSGWLEADHET